MIGYYVGVGTLNDLWAVNEVNFSRSGFLK